MAEHEKTGDKVAVKIIHKCGLENIQLLRLGALLSLRSLHLPLRRVSLLLELLLALRHALLLFLQLALGSFLGLLLFLELPLHALPLGLLPLLLPLLALLLGLLLRHARLVLCPLPANLRLLPANRLSLLLQLGALFVGLLVLLLLGCRSAVGRRNLCRTATY